MALNLAKKVASARAARSGQRIDQRFDFLRSLAERSTLPMSGSLPSVAVMSPTPS